MVIATLERLKVGAKTDLTNDIKRRTRQPEQGVYNRRLIRVLKGEVTVWLRLSINLSVGWNFTCTSSNFRVNNIPELRY